MITKIVQYNFGYVLEKVNARYEIIEEIKTFYIGYNIFGNELLCNKFHQIAWCRFTPGKAISSAFKTEIECINYRSLYEQSTQKNLP